MNQQQPQERSIWHDRSARSESPPTMGNRLNRLSQTRQDFVEWLLTEDADWQTHPLRVQLAQLYRGSLFHLVINAMQPTQVMGKGTRAIVYEIPGIPDYVLHVKPGTTLMDIAHLGLEIIPDPCPALNIGQPVARLGGDQITIRRLQAGSTYPMPYGELFNRVDIDAVLGLGEPIDVAETAPYRQAYGHHLGRVAVMPQVAYDQLVRTVITVIEQGLYLDPCAHNILLDREQQRFNTLDHQEYVGPYQNVLGILSALTDSMYVMMDDTAYDIGEPEPLAPKDALHSVTVADYPPYIKLRQWVVLKTLWAAYRLGLPLPDTPCPVNRFGFEQPSFDMNYILATAGLEGTWPILVELFRDNPTTSQRPFETLDSFMTTLIP